METKRRNQLPAYHCHAHRKLTILLGGWRFLFLFFGCKAHFCGRPAASAWHRQAAPKLTLLRLSIANNSSFLFFGF